MYIFRGGGGEGGIDWVKISDHMHVFNYQRILQPLIITLFLNQKHFILSLEKTTSEMSAELYGEGNEQQLCGGDWNTYY